LNGPKGLWAYEAFDFINDTYFGGTLPHPFIQWSLTPHGGCVASTTTATDLSRPPVITLHPSLFGGTEKRNPWGIPSRWLGISFAFDVLLHECIHVHINHNLGGSDGKTSHDCTRWMRQVNRIAKVLGFENIAAGRTLLKRIPDPSLPRTVRGKIATRVTRVETGNIPLSVSAAFPAALRVHLNQADRHFGSRQLPAGCPVFTV
jgi:hypothetical protein